MTSKSEGEVIVNVVLGLLALTVVLAMIGAASTEARRKAELKSRETASSSEPEHSPPYDGKTGQDQETSGTTDLGTDSAPGSDSGLAHRDAGELDNLAASGGAVADQEHMIPDAPTTPAPDLLPWDESKSLEQARAELWAILANTESLRPGMLDRVREDPALLDPGDAPATGDYNQRGIEPAEQQP